MGISIIKRRTIIYGPVLLLVGGVFLLLIRIWKHSQARLNMDDDDGISGYLQGTLENETVMEIHPPAIIVESIGGLGNQLFKFAASYALSRDLGVPTLYLVTTMTSSYKMLDPSTRTFAMGPFTFRTSKFVKIKALRKEEWDSISQTVPIHDVNCENLLFHGINPSTLTSQLLYTRDHCHSGIYFQSYQQEVKDLLSFTPEFVETLIKKPGLTKWISAIQNQGYTPSYTTVAIHVRRGDYLQKENWVTPLSYFQQAISLMTEKFCDVKFFVFSDDIDYVQANLNLKISEKGKCRNEFNFVSSKRTWWNGTYKLSSLEEFYLMTLCRNIILSNSTFSWWAAFLMKSKSKEQVVIGPTFHPDFLKHVKDNYSRRFKTLMWKFKYEPRWITIDPYDGKGL